MALSQQFLDEVRARTVLSALIGRSVKLVRAGREMKGCCPFHNEKTPSFHVNDDKAMYHCFGCGAHGDAFRWLTDHENMGFMDAVHQLAEAAGVAVPSRSVAEQAHEAQAGGVRALLERAAALYAAQLGGHAGARDYLRGRGLTEATVARYGLGYAPPDGGLRALGADVAALVGAGLLAKRDGRADHYAVFRDRLMIPIRDARGAVIGFAARALAADVQPKYLNSPRTLVFDKSRVLFNLPIAAPAARAKRRLIVVEGQFDAISMAQHGFAETVAPMGTSITEAHLHRAWRLNECPTLLLDGDAAGLAAAQRVCEAALPHGGPGRSLRVAQCPQGEDPDSVLRTMGADALDALLAAAAPMHDFLFARVAV